MKKSVFYIAYDMNEVIKFTEKFAKSLSEYNVVSINIGKLHSKIETEKFKILAISLMGTIDGLSVGQFDYVCDYSNTSKKMSESEQTVYDFRLSDAKYTSRGAKKIRKKELFEMIKKS